LIAVAATVGNFYFGASRENQIGICKTRGFSLKRVLCCPDPSPKRSKQMEESRMSSFVNPFDRHGSSDLPERAAAIKLWTRQNLPLTEETAVSVTEFACVKPSCPNRQTVILVLSEDMSTQKMSIHKAMADVCEADVFDACLELLRNWPA
jgi:hypothetical protein